MKERNLIRGLTSHSPVCRDVSSPQVSTSAAVQDVFAAAQSEIGHEDDLRGRRGRQAGGRRRGAWPTEISGDSTGEGGGETGEISLVHQRWLGSSLDYQFRSSLGLSRRFNFGHTAEASLAESSTAIIVYKNPQLPVPSSQSGLRRWVVQTSLVLFSIARKLGLLYFRSINFCA